MKKQRPTYSKPTKKFDKRRIVEEAELMRNYGLKNKKELWKAKQVISNFRNTARSLFTDDTGKDEFFAKLKREGIIKGDFELDDVLGLKVKDLLERRLQTIAFRKGLAQSVGQARQLITHGHIMVGDEVVSVPSYHVNVDEEKLVKFSERSPVADPEHPLRKAPEKEEKQEGEVDEENRFGAPGDQKEAPQEEKAEKAAETEQEEVKEDGQEE